MGPLCLWDRPTAWSSEGSVAGAAGRDTLVHTRGPGPLHSHREETRATPFEVLLLCLCFYSNAAKEGQRLVWAVPIRPPCLPCTRRSCGAWPLGATQRGTFSYLRPSWEHSR